MFWSCPKHGIVIWCGMFFRFKYIVILVIMVIWLYNVVSILNGIVIIKLRHWFIDYLIGGLEHGFYDFPYIGNFIIPTDSYFSEGWRKTTCRLSWKYVGDLNSFPVQRSCPKASQVEWCSHELCELGPWQKGCISYSLTKKTHIRTRSAIIIYDGSTRGRKTCCFYLLLHWMMELLQETSVVEEQKTHHFNRIVSRAILVDEDFNSVVHTRLRTFELEVDEVG